jgi:A/G-specific adenine glycosylase
MGKMNSKEFRELIWQKGRELYRQMPWREDTRPYYVLVSEIMLQQTQVDRVIPKFNGFIAAFPDIASLAVASLADVIGHWSGLGYNRRAKFLHEAAKKIVNEYKGVFPDNLAGLMSLPGVGPGTAGAILAYSFNQPVAYIETNIRTVFFHHFFDDDERVSDEEVLEKLVETLDHEHPREFYWALMDYGSYLKKRGVGRINRSKHYKKQPALKGSIREVRGQILKALVTGEQTIATLQKQLLADERYESALQGLLKDGLVNLTDGRLHLTK